ncbi:MAG TPA: hypothetical protein VF070_26340 [Streptosporangiaceae bacterium]
MQPAAPASEDQVGAGLCGLSRSLSGVAGNGDEGGALRRGEQGIGVNRRVGVGLFSPRQPVGYEAEGFVKGVQAQFVHAQRVDADHQADLLGLWQQQNPPWLAGHCSGRAAVENHPGPLLEGHRDAEVALYLYLLAGRSCRENLAGRQRTDRLSQHVGRWLGFQKVNDRVYGGELCGGVRTQQHRPGVNQVYHGRDQALRHGRPRAGRSCVTHDRPALRATLPSERAQPA